MIHTRTDQPSWGSTAVGLKAKPRTERSAAQHGVLLPAGAAPVMFIKKPSLRALGHGFKNYSEQLADFKRQRPEKHYQYLRQELRKDVPDPKVVKREFKKLCTCGNQSTISYASPVPDSEDGRLAAIADCQTLQNGIDKVLDYLPPQSHTAIYLCYLKVQLDKQVERIDEVRAREQQREATHARMTADLERQNGQAAKMSDQGTEGAVFLGTRLRRDTYALAAARLSPRTHAAADSLPDGSSESLVEEPSSAPQEPLPPATTPRSPRLEGSGPLQGFLGALPTKKEVQYQTVLKSVSDPDAAKGAVQVHDRVDYIQRHAGERLPFDVGCHVLVEPDPQLRAQLSERLTRTKTSPHRQEHLGRQQAALQNQPILLQEFLPGAVVSDLPFEERKAMVSDPGSCRRTGASLVVGPVLGLTDHLALNGMGYTNWSNVMTRGDGQLDMIDLAPQNKDIAKDTKASLKRLVHDLKQLALHVGPDRTLPSAWFDHMESSIDDFWRVTYTAEGGLFSLKDFMSPAEQQQEQQLSDELAALPHSSVMDRNFLKAQLKIIRETAEQRARNTLRPLRQQAAPAVLAGLVAGMGWLERNASTLREAHEVTVPGGGAQPELSAKDIQEITDILAELKPSERALLSSLKPPLPSQASILKA